MILSEASTADTNGKMHELTTAFHLNGGTHISKEHEEHYNKLSQHMTTEEKAEHMHRGEKTANAIRHRLASDGHEIHSVHITSKAGDIGKLTGHDESQHDNPSDVMVKTKSGHHFGYSLKTTQVKNGHVGIANPGHGRIDSDLKINTQQHLKTAHGMLEKHFSELQGKTAKAKKEIGKANPEIDSVARKVTKEAHHHIVGEMVNSINNKSHEEKLHFFRKHFHLEHSHTPHEKVTIHGTGDNSAVRIEHPGHEGDSIHHVVAHHQGNNTIEFHAHHHDGSISKYHLRAKPESGPFSNLKFSAEYRGKV